MITNMLSQRGEKKYQYKAYMYEDKNGECEIKKYIEKLQFSNSKDERVLANKIIIYIRYLKERRIIIG